MTLRKRGQGDRDKVKKGIKDRVVKEWFRTLDQGKIGPWWGVLYRSKSAFNRRLLAY